MLLATANAANFAQNCPKLPKSTQSRNFEIPPKIEILVIFKKKNLRVEEALSTINGEPPMNHIVDLCFVVAC
jgi:hypothetical protein